MGKAANRADGPERIVRPSGEAAGDGTDPLCRGAGQGRWCRMWPATAYRAAGMWVTPTGRSMRLGQGAVSKKAYCPGAETAGERKCHADDLADLVGRLLAPPGIDLDQLWPGRRAGAAGSTKRSRTGSYRPGEAAMSSGRPRTGPGGKSERCLEPAISGRLRLKSQTC